SRSAAASRAAASASTERRDSAATTRWRRRGELLHEPLRPARDVVQPLDLDAAAGPQEVEQLPWMFREVELRLAPIRPVSVGIGQLVLASDLPGAQELSGSLEDAWIRRERGD